MASTPEGLLAIFLFWGSDLLINADCIASKQSIWLSCASKWGNPGKIQQPTPDRLILRSRQTDRLSLHERKDGDAVEAFILY
jgi:hypothetical protein